MNSPLLGLYKTSSQSIYEATCLDVIRELSKNLLEDTPINESFTSMNGLDKCVEEINFTQNIKDIYNKYHDTNNRRGHLTESNKGYEDWNKIMEILKVGSFDQSIKDAVSMANQIRNDVGTQFYGMLLMSKGNNKKRTVFNPLHPVIAMELRKEDSSINTDIKKWTIAIYSFKDKREKQYKEDYPHLYEKTDYMDELGAMLAAIDTPSEYIIENSDFTVDIINDQFVLNYEEIKKEKDSGNVIAQEAHEAKSYIVPCQIINVGGVAYPYYGIIYSTKGLAWNMSPMQSANINHSHGQSKKDGMDGGSRICTHSGNSKTKMGISSLNHCNTTSPLNSDCMEEGSMTFAYQSIGASFELMGSSELLVETPQEPVKTLTYKEFVAENDGATKAQFLDYIRNKRRDELEADKDEEKIQKHEETTTEPTYPVYNLYDIKKSYAIGDIIKEPDGSLSQLTGKTNGSSTVWQTYIPPIVLEQNPLTIPSFNPDPLAKYEVGDLAMHPNLHNELNMLMRFNGTTWEDMIESTTKMTEDQREIFQEYKRNLL